MDIRLSQSSDRDEILRFISEMGFNPRDAVTWDALGMIAMTAWDGPRLVGAIPTEPRLLQIGNGESIQTLHETVVAVHPDWRSRGVGSQLQHAIFDARPGGAELLSVFREEPESAAYRWYVRNQFAPVAHVDSWFVEEPKGTMLAGFEVAGPDLSDEAWAQIEQLRVEVDGHSVGLIGRRERALRQWLECHPYRGRYSFHFVVEKAEGSIPGYALLGVGRMHSESIRADVLELCAADRAREGRLIRAVLATAAHKSWRPVRWPLAAGDPKTAVASTAGFAPKWGFDVLVRPLSTAAGRVREFATAWTYQGIDYA